MTPQRATQITEAILHYLNRSHWRVRIRSMKDFAGLCVYDGREIRLDVLHVLESPDEEVLDTIAHEIAHAIITNDEHGELWAETHRELRLWLMDGMQCDWLFDIPANIAALVKGRDSETERKSNENL